MRRFQLRPWTLWLRQGLPVHLAVRESGAWRPAPRKLKVPYTRAAFPCKKFRSSADKSTVGLDSIARLRGGQRKREGAASWTTRRHRSDWARRGHRAGCAGRHMVSLKSKRSTYRLKIQPARGQSPMCTGQALTSSGVVSYSRPRADKVSGSFPIHGSDRASWPIRKRENAESSKSRLIHGCVDAAIEVRIRGEQHKTMISGMIVIHSCGKSFHTTWV